MYDIEVTAQPRWVAALHIRLPSLFVSNESFQCPLHSSTSHDVPRNPLPPQTTSFFFAAEAIGSYSFAVKENTREEIKLRARSVDVTPPTFVGLTGMRRQDLRGGGWTLHVESTSS